MFLMKPMNGHVAGLGGHGLELCYRRRAGPTRERCASRPP